MISYNCVYECLKNLLIRAIIVLMSTCMKMTVFFP